MKSTKIIGVLALMCLSAQGSSSSSSSESKERAASLSSSSSSTIPSTPVVCDPEATTQLWGYIRDFSSCSTISSEREASLFNAIKNLLTPHPTPEGFRYVPGFADVNNAMDPLGKHVSPLHAAFDTDNLELISLLIAHGADASQQNNRRQPKPLIHAAILAKNFDLDIASATIHAFLSKNPHKSHILNVRYLNQTPLESAITAFKNAKLARVTQLQASFLAKIQALLDNGADIDDQLLKEVTPIKEVLELCQAELRKRQIPRDAITLEELTKITGRVLAHGLTEIISSYQVYVKPTLPKTA